MQTFAPETTEALRDGRVGLFVHFDFEFYSIRAHSGARPVEWDGHDWLGIGDVLRRQSSSVPGSLSATHFTRGTMAASLPLDERTHEVLTNQYFRDRPMRWSMCALDPDGNVIEQVHHNEGKMVECILRDDILTFMAEHDDLDSTEDRDARHRARVVAVRSRFRRGLTKEGVSTGPGWGLSAFSAIAGEAMGLGFSLFAALRSRKAWHALWQRLRARQRVYWFDTEPPIPRLRRHENGYRIRGDTLEEAQAKLHRQVSVRIWEFPRGVAGLLISVNGHPFGVMDLDGIRELDDHERYEATDPGREWLASIRGE